MTPEISYYRLVDFICRLANETTTYPYNNTGYGNTSQQLRSMVDHVAQMENSILRLGTFVEEARNMVRHTGGNNGTIKRAPKTNTLTGKRVG